MAQPVLRLVVFALLLFTGTPVSAESIIRGTIKNTEDGTINYYYKEHIIERSGSGRDLPLVDDRFEIRISNADPVKISFSFNHQQLDFFLLPDDSVSFSCDARDIAGTLNIKSRNGDDQIFMTSMSLIQSLKWKGMAPYEVKGVGWQNLPEGLMDSLDREVDRQQDAFKKSAGSRLRLSALLKSRLIDTSYKKAAQLMTRLSYQNASMGNMKLKLQGEKITEQDIETLLGKIVAENEDLIQNTDYIEFLYGYDNRAYEQYRKDKGIRFTDSKAWSLDRFAFQEQYYKSPIVRYAAEVSVFCRNNIRNPEVFIEGVARLNRKYPQGRYRDVLQSMSLSAKSLKAGQPAPSFNLKDIEGKEVGLEQLKGKVLYIDFWATWCLPCVMENKAVKAIKPLYRDKDVVFVYIIRDNNEAAWKKAVAEQGIEGLHLFGGGTTVFDQYQADGVPKYVLIGKDGKIVTADAPRPSDAARLTTLIDQALGQ